MQSVVVCLSIVQSPGGVLSLQPLNFLQAENQELGSLRHSVVRFGRAEEVSGLSLQPALGAGVWCEGLVVPRSTALHAGLTSCSQWRRFEPAPM